MFCSFYWRLPSTVPLLRIFLTKSFLFFLCVRLLLHQLFSSIQHALALKRGSIHQSRPRFLVKDALCSHRCCASARSTPLIIGQLSPCFMKEIQAEVSHYIFPRVSIDYHYLVRKKSFLSNCFFVGFPCFSWMIVQSCRLLHGVDCSYYGLLDDHTHGVIAQIIVLRNRT